MARLADKKVVVLGAASKDNIAQTTARLFAQEGATVLVSGRNEEVLSAFADEIGGHYALCDITDHGQVDALAATAVEKMGRVDAAVNATGWGLLKNLLEVTDDELDQIVALQFKGVHFFLAAFVKTMVEQDPSGGSIMQISSATTKALINDHGAYIGTKTGAEAMIRCAANDFGHHGIRCNTISPAFTESPMTSGAFGTPGLVDAFLPKYPLGRLNTAQDVAQAALWLASDEAFLTGQNIQPNGGLTLRGNPQQTEIGAAVGAAMAALEEAS